jgi:hypothetical protein
MTKKGKSEMKTLLIVCALLLSLNSIANAGDRVLSWDSQTNAVSYEIQQSIDLGKTWTVLATPASTVCVAALCQVTQTLPASGLVLIRFAARNAQGLTIRFDDGAWHCESCAPPGVILNPGIK